jgi:hypothetical protein
MPRAMMPVYEICRRMLSRFWGWRKCGLREAETMTRMASAMRLP